MRGCQIVAAAKTIKGGLKLRFSLLPQNQRRQGKLGPLTPEIIHIIPSPRMRATSSPNYKPPQRVNRGFSCSQRPTRFSTDCFTMSSLQEEMLAKKARLAEMRRQRELREKQWASKRQSVGGSVGRPVLFIRIF